MPFETRGIGGQFDKYESGMLKEDKDDKSDLYLWIASDIPYEHQFLTRAGKLAKRGAIKYGERNMELANSEEELERFKSSALRHMFQWLSGEYCEDHASAVFFNVMQAENVKYRLDEIELNKELKAKDEWEKRKNSEQTIDPILIPINPVADYQEEVKTRVFTDISEAIKEGFITITDDLPYYIVHKDFTFKGDRHTLVYKKHDKTR